MKNIYKIVKKVLAVVLIISASSCQKSDVNNYTTHESQAILDALGVESNISQIEADRIKENVEAVHFENVEDARDFITERSRTPYKTEVDFFTEKNLKKLSSKSFNNGTVTITDGLNIVSVPCDSQPLEPAGGCEDRGGSNGTPCNGNAILTSGNQSISFYYNATFDYNSSDGSTTASDFNSYTTGMTIGTSYTHMSSSYNTTTSGNINFTIRGQLNYNIFVDGIGTVFSETVTMTGNFNPCGGNGELELFLQPAD